MEPEQIRWVSGRAWSHLLDLILRMKADDEQSGGMRVDQLMDGDDPEAPNHEGDETQLAGSEEATRRMRNWKWAVAFNVAVAHYVEVGLKTILLHAGKDPGKGHDFAKLWEKLGVVEQGPERVQKEFAIMANLAATPAVGKPLQETDVARLLQKMSRQVVEYRYLETWDQEHKKSVPMEESDAGFWWERRVLAEAITRVARDCLPPLDGVDTPPGPASLAAMEAGELKEIALGNARAQMRWWLGAGMEGEANPRPEDPVWYEG